ncbi:hypothetical protein AB0J80_36205 [Actinoplanes sp. NPDC049548]|uniref:hypothetical protein n=1 Tax=Actinoplanes sp. NPDC049548 TaxID=3155152 RepID=UPI0034240E14
MTTAPEIITGASVLDWSVLEMPGVRSRVEMAAHRVAVASGSQVHLDADDLVQEGFIICATNPDVIRNYLRQGELSHLYVWVRSKLYDKVKVEVSRSGKTYSRDQLVETVKDGTW